jgi:hypothetical protein
LLDYLKVATAHYEVEVPVGWGPTITDRDVGYGFRSRWDSPDGSFLIIDAGPDPFGVTAQESALQIFEPLRSAGRTLSEVQQEPMLRDTWSFRYRRTRGEEALAVYFFDDGNGYGIVGGHPTDPTLAEAAARQAADSLQTTTIANPTGL